MIAAEEQILPGTSPAMANGSWGVCGTVNEPAQVLELFVRHYKAVGASEIILFFDEPDEALMARLAKTAGVICLPSRHLLEAPQPDLTHEQKQNANYAHAVNNLFHIDWCGHVDADEFLMPVRNPLAFSDYLAGLAPKVHAVKIAPAEAIFTVSDDITKAFSARWVRLPKKFSDDVKPNPLQAVYSKRAFSLLEHGLAGHISGKTFIRRMARFEKISLHKALPTDGVVQNLNGQPFAIVHFDAISYPDWSRKWRRRTDKLVFMNAMSNNRLDQFSQFQACEKNEDKERRLFEDLFVLKRNKLALLKDNKLALEIHGLGEAGAILKPESKRVSPARRVMRKLLSFMSSGSKPKGKGGRN